MFASPSINCSFLFTGLQGQPIHYSGAFQSSGVDNGVSLSAFKQNLRVEVKELRDDFLLFDIIGIDAAIANALRRILISEVRARGRAMALLI